MGLGMLYVLVVTQQLLLMRLGECTGVVKFFGGGSMEGSTRRKWGEVRPLSTSPLFDCVRKDFLPI